MNVYTVFTYDGFNDKWDFAASFKELDDAVEYVRNTFDDDDAWRIETYCRDHE